MAPFRLGLICLCLATTLPAQPRLTYEHFFGGRNTDVPTSVTTDLQGNVIVAGTTDSVDFPTTPGSYQPAVPSPLQARLSGSGSFQPVSIGPIKKVNAIAFSTDGSIGYADAISLTEADAIYRTFDSGRTWQLTASHLQYTASSLIVDPSKPSTLYALSGDSVYKSIDDGNSFTKVVLPAQNSYPPSFLTIDPTNSNRIFLIIGYMPSRVLRTTDGGTTWQQLSTGLPYSANVIAIDPTQPNLVYSAGTFENVFRSRDGGDTWSQLLPGTSPSFISAKLTVDSASVLYAATSKGIYKSTDNGNTHTLLPTPGGESLNNFQIDPRNGAHWIILSNSNNHYSVFESYDSGATWRLLPLNLGYVNVLLLGGDSLFAATQPRKQVFVTKWNSLTGTIYAATYLGPVETEAQPKVVTDQNGYIYVSGETSGTDFPVTPGAFQTVMGPNVSRVGFVAKLSPDLSQLAWSTLVSGGFTPPPYQGDAYISDLQVDASGSVYIGGASCSPDFPAKTIETGLPAPIVIPHYTLACAPNSGGGFVAKLNSSGTTMLYSTQLDGTESVTSLALDANGEVYVAGPAANRIPPGFQGLQPIGPSYVLKVSASGDKVDSLAKLNANASVTSIALAPSGDVLITGSSSTSLLPSFEGAVQPAPAAQPCSSGPADAYVLRATSNLQLTAFSFVGSGCEAGTSIRADRYGNIWVSGYSGLYSVLRQSGYQAAGQGFVAQLTPNANAFLFLSKVDMAAQLNISRENTIFLVSSSSRTGSLTKDFSYNSAGGTGLLTRIDP